MAAAARNRTLISPVLNVNQARASSVTLQVWQSQDHGEKDRPRV
jgi:hypothetical protein